jgi:hypothetical protein
MYSHLQGETVGPPGDTDEQDEHSSDDVGLEAVPSIGLPASAVAERAPGEDAPADAPLAEAASLSVVPRPTLVSSLLSGIARAMQVAAEQERERIDASVGEDETAQIEKIHVRAAAESDELKKQAEEDVRLVDAWREDQIQRVREDADRQIDDRRRRLEQSLTHHGSLIQTEVQSVQVAVRGYRASLGAFFGRLSEAKDPSAIARLAGTLPDPPDLQEVRADARSGAMKEIEQNSAAETSDPTAESLETGDGSSEVGQEPVGVMDPGLVKHSAATFSRTYLARDASVPSEPSDSQAPWSPTPSEVFSTLSPREAHASEENVAVRLIRSLTSRTRPTEGPEDR